MTIKISSAKVSTVKRRDPRTNATVEVTQVCMTLENTGSSEETVEIDIKARAKKYSDSSRKVFAIVCRKKKVKIGPRVDLGQISSNGYRLICCDVPNNIAADVFNFGGDYVVTAGGKRDGSGDVTDTIDVESASLPTRVSMVPGQRLRYSDILGIGFESTEGLSFDAASDLPPGWCLEFADKLATHGEAGFMPFQVEARPGALEGETATLVLRAFMTRADDSRLLIEESVFQFTVGSQTVCCSCQDDDAATDARTAQV